MEDFTQFLKLINNCDPGDPLLSATKLGECLNYIPLHYLTPAELSSLTQALNMEQLIPTEDGLARDYRGLAELMGFSSAEIETRFKRAYNPTKSLIDAYTSANFDSLNSVRNDNNIESSMSSRRQPVTVNDLLKFIERIERFDVIDDFMPTLIDLATRYKPNGEFSFTKQQQQHQLALVARNAQQYSSSESSDSSEPNILVNNFTRLTVDDTQYDMILYDAFVCFAPEDFHYAQELVALMEKHGKRLAVADDLLPGQFEFDALAQLIDSRCKKVIIILTPNFTRSRECEFQTKYASEIAIKAGYPKIIPVLYEACDDQMLPPMIRVISKIDMTNRSNTWQLNKLLRSLDFIPVRPITDAQTSSGGSSPIVHSLDEQLRMVQQHQQRHADGASQPSTPLIVLTDGSQSKFDATITTNEPVVELTHSESSVNSLGNRSINSRSQTAAENSSKSTTQESKQLHSGQSSSSNLKVADAKHKTNHHHHPITISSTLDKLRSFKQKMLGNGNSVESISSQAMLLRSTSPESEENVESYLNSSREQKSGM